MDRLMEFLDSLGITVTDELQAVVCKDAVLLLYIDEFGRRRIDVKPIDKLHLTTAESIDSLMEMEIFDDEDDEDDFEFFDEVMANVKHLFNIGDRVTVKGYIGKVFEVDGIISSMSFEEDISQIEVSYQLIDIETGENYESFEEDMFVYENDAKHKAEIKAEQERIDNLLDEYNDYMILYMNFGDIEYKEHADRVMVMLTTMK